MSDFTLGEKVQRRTFTEMSGIKFSDANQSSCGTETEGQGEEVDANSEMIKALQFQISARSKKLEIDISPDDTNIRFQPLDTRKSETCITPSNQAEL